MFRKSCFGAFVFFPLIAFAQTELQVEVSAEEVEVNKPFSVRFVLLTNERDFKVDEGLQLPDFEGFRVLSMNSFQNLNITNGNLVQQSGQQVQLVASKAGRFTIGSATIKVKGKLLKTKPITIKVVEGKGSTADPENQANEELKDLVRIVAEVESTNPYQNQEVLLNLKVYVAEYSFFNRLKNLGEPAFKGLNVRRVDERRSTSDFSQVRLGDKVFVSQTVRKYLITPQTPGKAQIAPFSLDVVVGRGFNTRTLQIQSNSIDLDVKPLPSSNQPKKFKGAVGNFNLLTNLDKSKLDAGQSATLDVEIVGTGNFELVSAPELEAPEEVEVFDPEVRQSYKPTDSGSRGKVAAEYVIVPEYGGEYQLPGIEFAYFDPEKEDYEILKSKAITLEVDGPAPPEEKAESTKVAKDPVPSKALDSGSFGDNKDEDFLAQNPLIPGKNTPEKSPQYLILWIALGAIVGLVGIFFLARKKRGKEDAKTNNGKLEEGEIVWRIPDVQRRLSVEGRELDAAIDKLLTEMGALLVNLPEHEVHPESAHELMVQKYGKNEDFTHWKALISEAKTNRYSPFPQEYNEDERREEVATLLERLLKYR